MAHCLYAAFISPPRCTPSSYPVSVMALHVRLSTVRNRLTTAVRHRFEIDARSLAAFRIALGLLVLADLILRSRNLTAFYTDSGVFPRQAFIAYQNPLHLSFHIVSGDAWAQALLFLLAGIFAVALTIGYRTSVATIGTWLFLLSLHNRMPEVLNGGDYLLRMLLFWSIFLPLGARWAIDALQADRHRTHVTNVASAALLLQVVIVYVANVVAKFSGEIWLQGDGLAYVFSLGQFTVLLGDHLGAYPVLLRLLSYLWLGTITLSFLLIVLTGIRRIVFVSLLISMHLGMLVTMRIDLFPLISVAGLLPFLPASFWEFLEPRFSSLRAFSATRRWAGGLAEALPTVTISEGSQLVGRIKRGSVTVVPLVFLVLIVLWNVHLGYSHVYDSDVLSDEAEAVIDVTRTDQYWNMFAPDPLSTDGWIVAPGRLENDTRIDAVHGGPVTWDRPPDISATYQTARWRKYLVGLWRYDTVDRRLFTEYLCRRWNDSHETELINVSVYFMEQPTQIHNETEPIDKVRLVRHRC